ncbi:hypothetical protein HNP99_000084 [Flavobacterium sp. 28A]|nr:hypothetical protein [Flavobacterium sp. 28A]NRT13759.1 hypothetical protein [Flavobacterium sp. 28A]
MKSIILLFIVFIFASCKNKDMIGLTNANKKWVYYNESKKYKKDSVHFLTYLKFNKNGECVNFFCDKNGGQYGPSMDWEFTKSDSILEIGGNKFLVLNIYNDSIIMKDLKFNRQVQLLNWDVLEKP